MPVITLYNENGEPVEVELPDEEPKEPKEPRSNDEWASLRKARKEADTAKKELAFLKAGIDTTDPKMSYFVKGYDGDISAEAIKTAALEAGFIQDPSSTQSTQTAPSGDAPLDPTSQAALEAGQRIASAGIGAMTPGATSGQQKLQEAYLAGGTNAMLDAAEALGITVVREQ